MRQNTLYNQLKAINFTNMYLHTYINIQYWHIQNLHDTAHWLNNMFC